MVEAVDTTPIRYRPGMGGFGITAGAPSDGDMMSYADDVGKVTLVVFAFGCEIYI